MSLFLQMAAVEVGLGMSVEAGEASVAVSQTFALCPAEVFVRNGCRPCQVPDRADQLNGTQKF